MKEKIFNIWEPDGRVTLTVYAPEGEAKPRPAVVVIPGGAYVAPSAREADPVALRFAEMGYVGCVLRNSTMYENFECCLGSPNRHTLFPEPLLEVGAAVLHLRRNAEQLGADGRIALCGFSAGGHLAANYCNMWNDPEIFAPLGASAGELRPNADILCYAALMLREGVPGAMHRAVLGEREHYPQTELDGYNACLHVSRDTPPTFLWHTADDRMVFVRSSYDMALALDEESIPYELHIFSSGPHAAALSPGLPAEPWPTLADAFLRRVM